MAETSIKRFHSIEFRDDNGDLGEAALEIRYWRIHVLPPIGKQMRYPDLTLRSFLSRNGEAEKQEDRLEAPHRLAVPIAQRRHREARWYEMRRKIEMFQQDPQIGLQG